MPWVDPNDPSYHLDTQEGEDRTLVKLKPLVPEMAEEDVRKMVEPLILEYFENGDSDEVLYSLEEKLQNHKEDNLQEQTGGLVRARKLNM